MEGLQTEPRAAPASGALPGFQPHLLLETESHGAWGPGSRRPFPTPVPSGPNEVGISPQLLCPRAWVLPEARPGPGARPSAPAWPGSASKTGFHGRHRSCARATAPRAPHDSVVRNWEPPPPKPHSWQRTVTRVGYFCLIIWFRGGDERQPAHGASSAAWGARDQLPPETISTDRSDPHPGSPSQMNPESLDCRRNAESSPGFRSLSVTPGIGLKWGLGRSWLRHPRCSRSALCTPAPSCESQVLDSAWSPPLGP